ncbi:MAG: sigma-70 family RNA polymerase sigma factor [Bryobacteraceae bacterium]|nr:sigma-70 family RNA polymerase sigma factor [Bryobacteraceae bacterium]
MISQTAAGDRGAFHSLVLRHQSAIYRHLRTLTPTVQDAEDALQETFLAAFRHAATYRGESSARTWLFTIARNSAFRLARKKLPSQTDSLTENDGLLDELARKAGFGAGDPEELAIRAQCRERMNRALSSLSAEDREILILRDLEGLSGEETSAVLSIGLAAMKSRLHRARLRLAAVLREQGA